MEDIQMHNLAGTWKSVDNTACPIKNIKGPYTIKSDNGTYVIRQFGTEVFIKGSLAGNFENFGYGKLDDDKDEFVITWADTYDSPSTNKTRCACKVRVNSTDNKTTTIEILNGGAMAFGTWEKIPDKIFPADFNFEAKK